MANFCFVLGLGESACSYFGNVRDGCDYETVAVDKLPDSCTSFLYNGLTVNITYEISPRVEGTSNGNLIIVFSDLKSYLTLIYSSFNFFFEMYLQCVVKCS